jgi:hypothetical protein
MGNILHIGVRVNRKQKNSYLGLRLESRLLIVMRKSIHNRIVIVGHSLQKLTTHLRRPEYLLQASRVLVDVLPQQCKWL